MITFLFRRTAEYLDAQLKLICKTTRYKCTYRLINSDILNTKQRTLNIFTDTIYTNFNINTAKKAIAYT